MAGDFEEDKHPRDHGKFTSAGGESGSGAAKPARSGKPPNPKAQAKAATKAADAASKTAWASMAPSDHLAAQLAHEHAAQAHTAAGDDFSAKQHSQDASGHAGYARSGTGPAASAPAPAAPHAVAPAPVHEPAAAGRHSDEHLAGVVHQTIASMPDEGMFMGSRFSGGKAYIGSVYDHMSSGDRSKFGTLDQFKSHLNRLNRNGHLVISRLDGQSDADAAKLERSEFTHMGSTFHVIQGQSERRKGFRPDGGADRTLWAMAPSRFKLTLTKLDFLSLVDTPAQETASIRLVKRKEQIETDQLTARILKVTDGADPLLYCWAFTTHGEDGQPYHDLQGDAITPDFIKAAEAFMQAGGAVDEMHVGEAKSRIAFAYPMDPDIAKAMLGPVAGAAVKTAGLMVAIRPTAEQLAKVRSGEFTGVSIAGTGIRELMKAAEGPACPGCGAYGKADDATCAKCGKAMKRRKPVAKSPPRRVVKRPVLTGSVDGHQHSLDLDDPADEWRDALSTSYQTSDGADAAHCHAWTFDAETGAITIADDSGHTHPVEDIVPDDVRAQAAANEDGERCAACRAMCDEGCKFCPSCGAAMDRGGGVPCATAAVEDSGSHASVVVISARAPGANSSPSEGTNTVKSETKEPDAMADNNELQALKAENALLKSMATLTDAQRAYHNKLIAKGIKSDADRFLALTPAQRDTELAELAKADTEVYTSKSSGRVYRKSDHLEIIEAAQQVDAMADLQKRLDTERNELEFTKRGVATLPSFAKGVKENLRGRIMKALAHEFTDAAEYAEAERAMKAANHALQETLSAAKGVNPHIDAGGAEQSPLEKFNIELATFAKSVNKSPVAATGDFLKTVTGGQLYAAAFPYSH